MFCLFQPHNPGKGSKVGIMGESESVLLPQTAALTVAKAKGKTYLVVIVGAGPAGIAATIYLKRAGIDPLVFERDEVGGLLWNAHLVENYPGFPAGLSGPDLVERFKQQLARWKIEIHLEEVHRVSKEGSTFKVDSESGEVYAKALIVATGTKPKKVELEGLQSVESSRVFYEVRDVPATATGSFLVLGGGDAAFDYALNLAERGFNVDIICRGEPKCLSLLLERVGRSDKILTHLGGDVKSVVEREDRLLFAVDEAGEPTEIVSDYGLIACGREAETSVLPPELLENWKEISGLYLVGDVRRGNYRQVGISVGDGILAAMSIINSLGEEH